ncbi:unnamed protein product, partial [Timema podura]|nr:unnamed protein product [Timema podura]
MLRIMGRRHSGQDDRNMRGMCAGSQKHEWKILPGDGLPAQVCHKCVFQINTSYDFIQVCENSDMKLRQFLAGFKLGAKSLFQVVSIAS